jgi:hypothetical protein
MWTSTITQIFFGLGLDSTAIEVVADLHEDEMTAWAEFYKEEPQNAKKCGYTDKEHKKYNNLKTASEKSVFYQKVNDEYINYKKSRHKITHYFKLKNEQPISSEIESNTQSKDLFREFMKKRPKKRQCRDQEEKQSQDQTTSQSMRGQLKSGLKNALSESSNFLAPGGYPMTGWEKVHWISLTLFTMPAVGFAPVMLIPIGWWTWFFSFGAVLAYLLVQVAARWYTIPAMKKAIHLNLNTHAMLQRFQETIMLRFAASLAFQVFILALFIYPSLAGNIDSSDLPGRFAGVNKTVDLYANGKIPMYVQFALPHWWYGWFPSVTFGLAGVLLALVDASGTFEAAKSTGKFNDKIATVMILWYLVILLGAFQLPNCIIPHNFKMLSYMDVLDGMHYRWSSLSTIFFMTLSGAQLVCGVVSLFLVKTIAKMTQDLKAGNKWHFFISHAQKYGADQCATLSAQLKQRGWAVWWDQNMDEIDTEAMQEGVQKSAVFLLFMTKSVFHRPYVRLEIEEALKLGKPILLVHEGDKRHGAFDFSSGEMKAVTKEGNKNNPFEFYFDDKVYQKKIENILSKNESIQWQRRIHLQEVVLHQVKQKFYQSLGAGEFFSALSKIIIKGDDAVKAAFEKADTNNNNDLDKEELKSMTEEFGLKLDEGQLESIFTSIDKDDSGGISFQEFKEWLDKLKNNKKVQ